MNEFDSCALYSLVRDAKVILRSNKDLIEWGRYDHYFKALTSAVHQVDSFDIDGVAKTVKDILHDLDSEGEHFESLTDAVNEIDEFLYVIKHQG